MNCKFCFEPCNPNYICCKTCGEDLTNDELIQKQIDGEEHDERI